jgi:Type II secretion system (T2SS), protein G
VNCPRCKAPLSAVDQACTACGLVVGESKSGGVPGWVWAIVVGVVLVGCIPCGCLGLFLAAEDRGQRGATSTMTTNMSSDAAEGVAALPSALREWSDSHGGRAPERLELLLEDQDRVPAYLPNGELPRDRFGNAHDYRVDESDGGWRVELWSLGADGAPGGEGEDKDECVLVVRFEQR